MIANRVSRVPRIGLISPWASRLGGGVFEAVVAQADLIRSMGWEPRIFSLADKHTSADAARFGGATVELNSVVGLAMLGFAPGLSRSLADADLDLLHLHGIWMYPSWAAASWAARTGKPYIISPHGMLDPWITGRGKLKKAIARTVYERRSWRLATRFHALTGREADDIDIETNRGSRAVIIPNAVSMPVQVSGRPKGEPFVLYLGRIHPKKNLDALIDGWRAATDSAGRTGTRLLIAGWGEASHVTALEQRLALDGGADIEFLGPVYGGRKAELLSGARFLALPSLSEGLPVVVLEAWAAGTPTLMSSECNLPEGFNRGAAIDCGIDAGAIATALRLGLSLPSDGWNKMSGAASRLAQEIFSPEIVAGEWERLYRDLIHSATTRKVKK